MDYRIIIPKTAQDDLEEIATYIGLDNLQKAMSFIDELREYIIRRLGFMPLSAKIVKNQIRMTPYKRYNIFYIVSESNKIVTIIHIFAGGRDWENII